MSINEFIENKLSYVLWYPDKFNEERLLFFFLIAAMLFKYLTFHTWMQLDNSKAELHNKLQSRGCRQWFRAANETMI